MGKDIAEEYFEKMRPKQPKRPWQIFEEHMDWFYSDHHGKIKALQGAQLAQKTTKYPRRAMYFSMTENPNAATPSDSLARFKGLLHVIRQLKNTAGAKHRLENLCRAYAQRQELATDDLELYLPVIRFFSNHYRTLANVLRAPRPQEFLIDGPITKHDVEKLKQRADPLFYEQANAYLYAISSTLGKRAARDKKNQDLQEIVTHIMKLQQEITNYALSSSPKTRYGIDVEHLNSQGETTKSRLAYFNDDALTPAQARKRFSMHATGFSYTFSKAPDRLAAKLNNSATNLLVNVVNCCISGPYGKSKEASILHWLDPAVHVWEITPDTYPAGLVLCVEATGNHASRPDDLTKYLVLEGFPANKNFYANIASVYSAGGDNDLRTSEHYTLAKMAYIFGLKTAQTQGISKLFINAEHTGRQQSVEDTVFEAAKANIPDHNTYRLKDEKFVLRKDPHTNAPFAQITVGDNAFAYTHHLQKQPLNPELVTALRNDPHWNGEGYFDTWYGWNKFIGNLCSEQVEEIGKSHPYARRVWERAQTRRKQQRHPESYWNLGIGYCRGIEVDVAKECARLNIK
jgi:hypothetical protein